jgi:hypothetical protein
LVGGAATLEKLANGGPPPGNDTKLVDGATPLANGKNVQRSGTILDSLAELERILISSKQYHLTGLMGLVPICQSFAQPKEDSNIQDLVKELNVLLEKVGLLNKNNCEGNGISNIDAAATESLVHGLDDIFLSIRIYTASLIELLPSMENTLDYICNSEKKKPSSQLNLKCQVQLAVMCYVYTISFPKPIVDWSNVLVRLIGSNTLYSAK